MSRPAQSVADTVLSPFERVAEIIFGILMAISVTAAAEIGSSGGMSVRELLLAALGCNMAWGLIDGAIFLLQAQFDRHRQHRMILELRDLASEDAFRARASAELPPAVAAAMTAESFARLRAAARSYTQARPAYWSRQELAAAGLICALVFGSTFPLVVPFLAMQDPILALRASHAVAVAMLFVLGWKIGRWSGVNALGAGSVFALVGSFLAILCVALGG
jgi:VIT1/CCC1 family predicted Fe2+/Mn2+ transporter